MKCKKCGTALEKGQTVCPNCAEENQLPRKTRKQRRKEKILKITFSIIGGMLAVALVVGLILTGINEGWGRENNIYRKVSYCTSELGSQLFRSQVVATAGPYELTNGQLQVLYKLLVLDYLEQFGDYLSYSGIDLTKPLSDQVYDQSTGLTWEKLFLQQALNEWLQYCIVNMKATDSNYQLPAEFADHLANLREISQKSAEEGGFKSIDAMLRHDVGVNVRYEDYYNYLSMYYVYNNYSSELMKAVEISEEELEQYFQENESTLENNYGITKENGDCVDVRHILIMPEGGTLSDDGTTTTYSDAEWEACRVKAQAVYDEWLAGDKTEDSFSELANEKSQDQNGKVTNGGLYEDVSEGQMVTAFDEWCFDSTRSPGDHGLIKTEYGYHVMYFVEAEPIWKAYCRLDIQNLELQTIMQEYLEKLEWKIDYSKIVLDNIELS